MPTAANLHRTLRGLPRFFVQGLAYGQLGLFAIIDTAQLAPLGTTPLAAAGFAMNVLAPFFIFATAGALALGPFVAREASVDRDVGALRLLLSCLRAQGIIAAASIAVLVVLARHLDLFGQPVEVAIAARPYFEVMPVALLPIVGFAALREYAIGVGAARAVWGFGVLALGLKIGLGALLVHGSHGPLGAALATAIASGATTLLFAVFLWRRGHLAGLAAATRALRQGPVFANPLFGQGLSAAMQQLFEIGAYYFAGIMAGWLGAAALAAHAIGLNIAGGAALISLAVSQATAAEVGRRARTGEALAAARTGALTAVAAMAVVALGVVVARRPLFAAAAEHTALAWLIALSLFADGAQIALGGALRGLLDARYFALVSGACWWLLAMPLAYLLAFVLGLGIFGLWLALCATLVVCAILFAVRVVRLSHQGRPLAVEITP